MDKAEELLNKIEELENNINTWGNSEKPTMMLFKAYESLLNNYNDIIPPSYSKPYKTFTLLIKDSKYDEIREELKRDLFGLKSVIKSSYSTNR